MAKNKMDRIDIEARASEIMQSHWSQFEDAVAFVTDRVAFNMRNLIKTLRKNYWGIFDEPEDPTNGNKKIFIPLTESTVEGVVKNIDLDTKDIGFRAKKPESIDITHLIRSGVKNELDAIFFGESLDEAERQLAIDGTIVWKTVEVEDPVTGEKRIDIRLVDLLNFSIDPTARSIQETDLVVERFLYTKKEFDALNVPFNADQVAVTKSVSRLDKDLNIGTSTSVDYVELYEAWGLIPKSLLTGLISDDDKIIHGRILASQSGKGGFVIHDIEENKKKIKPYEEAWYKRIHGRWYGKGIAEMVMMLQLYLNTVVNVRIARNRVSQLGLFKMRKGSGITPQMFKKLSTNGVIPVNNMQDLEQLIVQEASQSSYADEENAITWAERVTNAYGAVLGEQLPSTTPATNAVIQNNNAQSGFTLVKEGFGMFLQRWLKRHYIPLVAKKFKKGYLLQVTGEPELLRKLDERVIAELAYQELDKIQKSGGLVNNEQVLREIQRAKDRLDSMGNVRYAELIDNIDFTEFDVQVQITNEEVDKGVLVQNLISILTTITQLPQVGIRPEDVISQIFDLMGLNPPRQRTRSEMTDMQQQIPQGQTQLQGGVQGQAPTQSPQEVFTNANTL